MEKNLGFVYILWIKNFKSTFFMVDFMEIWLIILYEICIL